MTKPRKKPRLTRERIRRLLKDSVATAHEVAAQTRAMKGTGRCHIPIGSSRWPR